MSLFSFMKGAIALRCFFFFQAEDGIRDGTVTGVQTCALPISAAPLPPDTAKVVRQKLDAARARRLRIAQAEQDPDPDTAAISVDAQTCAADAHRSWAAQFPEAAAATDTGRAMQLIWAPGAEALYLEAVCTATWARMQGFTPLIERRDELVSAFERVA